MRTWAKELKAHTHDYVRRGGKENRRKQVSRIIKFLRFTDSNEKITSLHRLGKRHVIEIFLIRQPMTIGWGSVNYGSGLVNPMRRQSHIKSRKTLIKIQIVLT